MSFVSKEIRRFGYIVVNDVQVLAAQYHFECDSASDLPTQTQFQNDKNVFLFMGSTAHTITDNKQYEMKSDGIWVDITPNSGGYTLPPASISSLGGIIVGSGLSIDADGVLSASGGSGMPYTNHNGGIRGQNLGSSYTAEQKAAIAAGTFDDIYVGDYWEINGMRYVIVDIDYYMNYGHPAPTTQHHVIVYPSDNLSTQGYTFDSYFYGNSSVYTTYLPAIASNLEAIFGNYLINQTLVLYNSGGMFWGQAKCVLPSIVQIEGYSFYITPDKEQHRSKQFAYFRYDSSLASPSTDRMWLRDSNNDGYRLFYTPVGSSGNIGIGASYYLRPYFILSGTAQT